MRAERRRARRRPPRLAAAALVLLVGCAEMGAPEHAWSTAFTPTLEQLRSATYRGLEGVGGPEGVRLRDGRWQGEPAVAGGASAPRVVLLEDLLATGDLDGDGVPEAVVGLSASTGGSGDFLYLAAMGGRRDGVVDLGTVLVGDRVEVMALAVEPGEAVLEAVVAGPEDPLCCPTRKQRRRYALREGAFAETASEELGRLSVADIEGVPWRLVELGPGAPVPSEVAVTVTLGDGSLWGTSGCNRYAGSYTAGPERSLAIGPLSATRMACPPPQDEVESRFLRALGGVTRFRFVAGRLRLEGAAGDGSGALVFARGG